MNPSEFSTVAERRARGQRLRKKLTRMDQAHWKPGHGRDPLRSILAPTRGASLRWCH